MVSKYIKLVIGKWTDVGEGKKANYCHVELTHLPIVKDRKDEDWSTNYPLWVYDNALHKKRMAASFSLQCKKSNAGDRVCSRNCSVIHVAAVQELQ